MKTVIVTAAIGACVFLLHADGLAYNPYEPQSRNSYHQIYYGKHGNYRNASDYKYHANYKSYKYYGNYSGEAQNQAYQRRGRSIETYSSMPRRIYPVGERVFVFSPRMMEWGAYDPNGILIKKGIASGGATWCAELNRPCLTPRGKFRVFKKGDFNCRSSLYPLPHGGAQMPFCMHFTGGYAIHGSPYVPEHNASHGCIRVKPEAAQWLHQNFINRGTRVVVLSYS